MLTPVHRALGLPAGPFEMSLIYKCVESGIRESDDLDWKQAVYPTQKPNWQEEAAKDIAAMANSGGGWIVFGVEDRDDQAVGVKPVPWSSKEEQRLRQAAYTHIAPPVVGLEFHIAPDAQGSVVAMRIPDSKERPHLSRKGETFQAPQRNGAHTVFMNEREIERAYRLRFQDSLSRENDLAVLFEDTTNSLDRENGVCLVFTAVPEDPRSGAEISDSESAKLLASLRTSHLYDGPSLTSGDPTDVRRGLRSWVLRGRGKPPYKITMHEDGTVTAIHRLGGWDVGAQGSTYYPAEEPNHCRSRDVETTMADDFALLGALAVHLNVQGGYTVRAGLAGRAQEPIYVRTTEGRSNYLLGEEHQEPINAFRPLSARFDPLLSDENMLQTVREMCLDTVNQGGVRYLKQIKG